MKMRLLTAPLVIFLMFFTSMALANNTATRLESSDNLTILVDADLMVPATELARIYTAAHHTPLTVAPIMPGETKLAISQGLEAHVVITANDSFIESLSAGGLMDVASGRAIARTQLALVAPKTLPTESLISDHLSFAAILASMPNIAVASEAANTESGRRVQAMLTGYSFSATLKKRLITHDSRAALLTYVQETPSLGLLLATDAVSTPDLVVLSILPDDVSAPVRYDALVLASESMEDARAFVRFMESPEAQTILSHYGFQPPDKL